MLHDSQYKSEKSSVSSQFTKKNILLNKQVEIKLRFFSYYTKIYIFIYCTVYLEKTFDSTYKKSRGLASTMKTQACESLPKFQHKMESHTMSQILIKKLISNRRIKLSRKHTNQFNDTPITSKRCFHSSKAQHEESYASYLQPWMSEQQKQIYPSHLYNKCDQYLYQKFSLCQIMSQTPPKSLSH